MRGVNGLPGRLAGDNWAALLPGKWMSAMSHAPDSGSAAIQHDERAVAGAGVRGSPIRWRRAVRAWNRVSSARI
jgi:hypothetical protein